MRLTLRVDATAEIGAGHAMRCLTLAEAWIATGCGSAALHGRVTIPFVLDRLRASGVEHVGSRLDQRDYDVVVVDSYSPSVRDELAQVHAALRVAVDDVGEWVPADGTADVTWNPNPHGARALYPSFTGVVLAGPRYVPIRQPLPAWSALDDGSVGVSLGGSSLPTPIRDVVIEALGDTSFHHVSIAGDWGPPDWRRVAPTAPWGKLAQCGRIIVGAGTSAWEAAAIGIPALVLCIADNQRPSMDWVRTGGGAAVDLTCTAPLPAAAAIRDALGRAVPLTRLTSGAARVAWELVSRAAPSARFARASTPEAGIALRRAAAGDAYALWLWANDSDTRRGSFGRAPIPWMAHIQWLHERSTSPDHDIFIAVGSGGQPLGSIRFDSTDAWRTARLNYVVAPEARGQGYATPLVEMGVAAVRASHPNVAIFAEVSMDNERSLKVFRRSRGWSAPEFGFGEPAVFWNR